MNSSVRNRTVSTFAIAALALTLPATAHARDTTAEKNPVKQVSAGSPLPATPAATTAPKGNSTAIELPDTTKTQTPPEARRPSPSELVESAQAREDSPEYQAYQARVRRDVYKHWQPKKAFFNLPVLAFNVSENGTVSNVTVVAPSESKEFDESAVKAIETAGKFEIPPAPVGAPVLLDFAFDPWLPDSALPYPEIPEEFLSTLGCVLEFTGFTYAFYLLLVAFALVCIKKFSRAIQMAFASIVLAISSLAVPGVIYMILDKMGVNESNGWLLVQGVTIFGVIALLAGVILPIVVAATRGKRGSQLVWVSVVTLLGSIVPFLWPVGLFLACMGPRANKKTNEQVPAASLS
ncbi:TonB family protein [Candidatus Obscuribacterales bacterium]|nr:TonB family protein [Candidatus Obscuribacterales bacterium]